MTYDKVFHALGPATRRAIFERLCDGPSSVTALAAAFPVSRPAVSQHLKALREAGLVREIRSGTKRIYSVEPQAVAALRAYFDGFWDRALHSFKRSLEGGDA
ncbi:MAG: metalloregulator ArsR/SmtB family transcription factor [Steroidobacteraceae bacterium]